MSAEEELRKSEAEGDTTYDKAKSYWNKVEPTVCGMLGGLPEVGFIGDFKNFILISCFYDNSSNCRHSSLGSFPENVIQV